MQCPGCLEEITRQQRGGRRCRRCGRLFAFDPKTNRLLLHDLRVGRLAERLGEGGRYWYTPSQLAWRAVRKVPSHRWWPSCGLLAVLAVALLLILPATAPDGLDGVSALLLGTPVYLGALAGGVLLLRWAAGRRFNALARQLERRSGDELFRPWTAVYGRLPPGMLDPGYQPDFTRWPGGSRQAAVVCHDVDTLRCLAANGVPDRLGLALLLDPQAAPPGTPLVLLHDAESTACRNAGSLRTTWPAPVADAGLHPRHVTARPELPRWRASRTARPRGTAGLEHLAPAEAEWLRRWRTPLAALSPRHLVEAVERATLRLGPDAQRARAVGFTTDVS